MLETLKNERQAMRELMATLYELSSGVDRKQTAADRSAFAQTLLALARTLDSHVEAMKGKSCLRYSVRSLPQIAFPLSRGY